MVVRLSLAWGVGAGFAFVGGCAASIENGDPPAQVALPQSEKTIAQSEPEPHPRPAQVRSPQFERPPKLSLRELTLVRKNRNDAPSTFTVSEDELPDAPTKILDPTMAERLFGNTGITLQWIGWEERGPTLVAVSEDGYWMLLGGQKNRAGGELEVEGFITEIGSDYFLYDGTIKIFSTPDKDRQCNVSKRGWRYGITQNRKYWRLREFEWCDYLTDYVDIYFFENLAVSRFS